MTTRATRISLYRVEGGKIRTIGGNVGSAPGQISSKTFVYSNGALVNKADPRQRVFVVIRSFLP